VSNFNDSGVEEIVRPSGVTQRRSIIGQLQDKEQAFPTGNPKLNYNRGLWFADFGGQSVFTHPDDEGVGIFFDAQLNPVDDTTASWAFGAKAVAEMKAKRRMLDLKAAATAKVEAMMKAQADAVQAELNAALADEAAEVNEPNAGWTTPDLNTAPTGHAKALEELAQDGERAYPVKK
jgi:hypothetical protein